MASKITCAIPAHLSVWSPTTDGLSEPFTFKTKHFSVVASFKYSEQPTTLEKPVGDDKVYANIYAIALELVPDTAGHWSDEALQAALGSDEGRGTIVTAVLGVGNQVLRALRVYGNVIGLDEFRFRSSPIDAQFRRLHLVVEVNSTVFEPPKRSDLVELFTDFEPGVRAYFTTRRSPQVREALEDNRAPEPEDEFLINSFEFLEHRNLRMAIVECTIALDIALSSYLRAELERRGIPNASVEEFLNPALGLTNRIKVLLPVLAKIEGIDLGKVLALITHRNGIIHKTGYLHESVTFEVIEDKIATAADLIGFLQFARRNAKLEPQREAIVDSVMAVVGVLGVEIEFRDEHIVWADITFTAGEIAEDVTRRIVSLIAAAAASHDKRFQQDEHLIVKFGQHLRPVVAAFVKGRLYRVPNPSKGEKLAG